MEFAEVMRQWKRMCDSMSGCVDCQFNERDEFYCTNIYCFPNGMDWSKIESIVMSWAAEHPEPVYPCWGEYLEKVIPHGSGETMLSFAIYAMQQPIPADIAEKLGIEPKGVK